MGLRNVVAGELIKLRTLPAVVATMLATVGTAIFLGGAVAASSNAEADMTQVMLQTIPFLQIGPVLIGVLAVATDYESSQIRTTMIAVPNRLLLLAGKSLAYLIAAALTSVAAAGAGLGTAAIMQSARGTAPTGAVNGWAIAGAVLYLVLIGLLGFALTVLLRSLIPPLVTMVSLVFIASPLLAGYTEHARWLPDQAGSLLYLHGTNSVFTPSAGTLVLLTWIAATAIAGVAGFLGRDV